MNPLDSSIEHCFVANRARRHRTLAWLGLVVAAELAGAWAVGHWIGWLVATLLMVLHATAVVALGVIQPRAERRLRTTLTEFPTQLVWVHIGPVAHRSQWCVELHDRRGQAVWMYVPAELASAARSAIEAMPHHPLLTTTPAERAIAAEHHEHELMLARLEAAVNAATSPAIRALAASFDAWLTAWRAGPACDRAARDAISAQLDRFVILVSAEERLRTSASGSTVDFAAELATLLAALTAATQRSPYRSPGSAP